MERKAQIPTQGGGEKVKCPVCERRMHNGGSIGHYCCRKGCPVADDALLWTPERIKKWKASQGEQGDGEKK